MSIEYAVKEADVVQLNLLRFICSAQGNCFYTAVLLLRHELHELKWQTG